MDIQSHHPEEPLAQEGEEKKKRMRRSALGWFRDHRIRDLLRDKRRLVEVPYTATLAHTVNALAANNVVAVPVAAPPGQWIGAGGSMILESDPATGNVRKHYIGMITMLDVLLHIAEVSVEIGRDDGAGGDAEAKVEQVDLDKKMSVPVASVIGHSLEGLSLWTLNPNTSILDCMELFSKGVHRALVPLESQLDHVSAAELGEASPGYRMLTQMDLLSFLRAHSNELKDIISCSVEELGAVNENVFAVTKYTKVIEAIKSMRTFSLNAVPLVESFESSEGGQILQDGKGRKLIGTFSATDLRGCPIALLQSSLSNSIAEFTEMLSRRTGLTGDGNYKPRKLITCHPETSLEQVMEAAVVNHVHRLWVVDGQGLLRGLTSLTDMLQVIRVSALLADCEHHVTPDQTG